MISSGALFEMNQVQNYKLYSKLKKKAFLIDDEKEFNKNFN